MFIKWYTLIEGSAYFNYKKGLITMKKIIAALISLTLFYSSTVCVFAIENQ